ncbi:CBS domain-containing protein [Olivibacter sp. SDN3]|uniref:CBS domain-containing protein n=1 Tax=Olivibacter sp. SDN3 TaxID=2764720 RepID=UPI001651AE03|nr:CBS domain-containing protein [Olivibacter sp. SDN3]QNL49759.1 CBS domain-containing protein [Olivibacter sp. SDN3]
MKTVQHILNNKPAIVYAVSSHDSVFDALELMMEKNISALLVIEHDELLGIFTERDYARKIILQGKASKDTSIREVMTANPQTITSFDRIDHCMSLMTNNHFRHLPVVENKQVIGMLSIGDLVKSIIEDQKETISQLESYINS